MEGGQEGGSLPGLSEAAKKVHKIKYEKARGQNLGGGKEGEWTIGMVQKGISSKWAGS